MVGGANSAGQAALHFAKYARKVTMLVRGEGLAATMSKYLIDEIERTSNIVVEAQTQVVAAMGEERLGGLAVARPEGGILRTGLFVVRVYRRGSREWNGCRTAILRDEKGFVLAGPDLRQDGKAPEWLAGTARAVPAGDERSGGVCGRGCAARIGEARGFGGGRGIDRGAVCAPVSGRVLNGDGNELR